MQIILFYLNKMKAACLCLKQKSLAFGIKQKAIKHNTQSKSTVLNTEYLNHEILKQTGQNKQTHKHNAALECTDMNMCFRIHRTLLYL